MTITEDSGAQPRTASLERDIADTRDRMSRTIDAIEERLSPRQLSSQFFEYLKDGLIGNEGTKQMLNTIRENPLPVTVCAVGLGWLLLATQVRNNSNQGSASNRTGSPPKGSVSGAIETAGEYAGSGYEKLRSVASDVGQKASAATSRVREFAEQPLARATEFSKNNPLAIGAAGLAIGAALGAIFPGTTIEREYLGDAADKVMEKTTEVARDALDKADQVVSQVGSAAADAFQKAVEPKV